MWDVLIILGVTTGDWASWGHETMAWSALLKWVVAFERLWIWINRLKVCRTVQHSPDRRHQPQPVDTRQGEFMDSCSLCQIVTQPSACFRSQQRSRPIWPGWALSSFWMSIFFVSLCLLQPQISSQILADGSGNRCGLLLLQPIGLRFWCVVRFWDVFLLITVVQTSHLSYFGLFVMSNQTFVHNKAFISLMNKAFLFTELPLTGGFFPFYSEIVLEILCVRFSRRAAVEKYLHSSSGTSNHTKVEATKMTFTPIFWYLIWTLTT